MLYSEFFMDLRRCFNYRVAALGVFLRPLKMTLTFITPFRLQKNKCFVPNRVHLEELDSKIQFYICNIEVKNYQFIQLDPIKVKRKNGQCEEHMFSSIKSRINLLEINSRIGINHICFYILIFKALLIDKLFQFIHPVGKDEMGLREWKGDRYFSQLHISLYQSTC